MKPQVAVITRTKNRGILLRRALLSVATQSLQDYIHVIVNDGGSTSEVDLALLVLEDKHREKIKVITYEESKGMEAASNIGISESDSEYIVIHDDDDSWQPDFLETTVAYLNKNIESYGIATQSIQVRERVTSGKVKIINTNLYKKRIKNISIFSMCSQNSFPPISFLFRRKALNTIGMYNETLSVLGDWEFNLRFIKHYDIEYLKIPLANYHHRADTKGSFGNSIFNDSEKHLNIRNNLNNRFLRLDIHSNNMNIGFIINLSQRLDNQLNPKKIKEKIEYFFYSNKITMFIRSYFPDQHAKNLQKRFH